MRFLVRAAGGILLLAVTLGLLMLAAGSFMRDTLSDDTARGRPSGAGGAPLFAARLVTFEPQNISPVLTVYGQVASWRKLDLRAPFSGRLTQVSTSMRDGAMIAAGAALYAIDPRNAEAALARAQASLAEAEAAADEAAAALVLARDDLLAAERQSALRSQALGRQQDLLTRGVISAAEVETAELALEAAMQAILGRRSAVAQAEARIASADITIRRARIDRDDAARTLDDAVTEAPFDGVLDAVTAIEGRLVGTNEQLGVLIDTAALDVEFSLSITDFAAVTNTRGALLPLSVVAELAVEGQVLRINGQLDRVAASVGAGQAGRSVFARLDASAGPILRDGDFVTVRINLPELQQVAVIPARAATADGRVLILGDENRLEDVQLPILVRQGDDLIVGDAPFGRAYVAERAPQLGAGIQIEPIGDVPAAAQPQGVMLEEQERAALIAQVEANTRMPAAVKDQILAQLRQDPVPQDVIDRLRSGGRR